MDMLSEAVGSVRIGRAEAMRVTASGAWGMRFPDFAGSGFHILLRGTGWLITGAGQPQPLKPGDVVLTPNGTGHGMSHTPGRLEDVPPGDMSGAPPAPPGLSDVELLCGAYWLDHGPMHHYLRALPEVIAISPDYDHDPQLRSLADLLAADVAQTRSGAGVTRPALLDLLLTHILRHWLERNRDVALPETNDPQIAAVLHAIHASPDAPWTVERLSQVAQMSRTTFTRRFTTFVGRSPMTYLTSWRLAHAARLLRQTDAPLAKIARQVGYSTEFAFGSAFRREYGIPPGRFRAVDVTPRRAEG